MIAILSIAVDGGNTSSVSNKTPVKLDDRTIICNVVQESHSNEAIKSIQATLVTLEKKFEQLMAAMNKTTHGNPAGQSFASCKEIYENHK
ncbi:hypothetical protein OS493_038463 [Desmophyllum pertusum]|uniref:Uncharacterized protein n=1 Tax=Desmophyllum pertusum TaxID=174260 RepID=A0A9W9Y773_9CNID|nr:hypothetical protein OS493_038463 [Desmophyllum pertusum]